MGKRRKDGAKKTGKQETKIKIIYEKLVVEILPDGTIGREWQTSIKFIDGALMLGIAQRQGICSYPNTPLFPHLLLDPKQFHEEVIKAIEKLEAENEKAKNNKPPNERG